VSALPRQRPARLLAGGACVALGAYLIAAPFSSLPALAAVTGASLLIAGLGELVDSGAHRGLTLAAGGASVVAGLIAIVWPGITLLALALVAGLALLVGGLTRLLRARIERGEERLLLTAGGFTGAIAGLLALAWPSITVLALALIVGVRTVVFGLGALASALRPGEQGGVFGVGSPRAPMAWLREAAHRLRLLLTFAGLALALCGMGVSIALHAGNGVRPGPFYTPPSPLPPGPHGTLIREQLIPHLIQGAKTYRVLYKTTGFDGHPAAASGLVIVPEGPVPKGGRNVIAFTHGTLGVSRDCAPSLHTNVLERVIEGLGQFLAAGDVIAATDYQGLGTPGPNAYLVGRVEGMNALDAVRAAHRLPEADAGVRFAVWGHSQGGQASLFTGQLAPSYVPELHLVGVAAGAPVPEPIGLFKVNLTTTVGRVLIAMAVNSWSQLYSGASLGQIVTPVAQGAVASITSYCLYGKQALATFPAALTLGVSFVTRPPWEVQPWREIMEQNTPGRAPLHVPVLIVQGGADTIVPSHLTEALAAKLCSAGETVDLRLYPTVGHLETGIVASPDVAAWIAQRFAGKPPPSTCG
jgi:uncharacterized membrane protein HdeD (DUF308 family)/pimeloyl-ACP methyl ester carboxylesterase